MPRIPQQHQPPRKPRIDNTLLQRRHHGCRPILENVGKPDAICDDSICNNAAQRLHIGLRVTWRLTKRDRRLQILEDEPVDDASNSGDDEQRDVFPVDGEGLAGFDSRQGRGDAVDTGVFRREDCRSQHRRDLIAEWMYECVQFESLLTPPPPDARLMASISARTALFTPSAPATTSQLIWLPSAAVTMALASRLCTRTTFFFVWIRVLSLMFWYKISRKHCLSRKKPP